MKSHFSQPLQNHTSVQSGQMLRANFDTTCVEVKNHLVAIFGKVVETTSTQVG